MKTNPLPGLIGLGCASALTRAGGGVAAVAPRRSRRAQAVQRSTGISSRLPLGWSARVCSAAPPMRATEGST